MATLLDTRGAMLRGRRARRRAIAAWPQWIFSDDAQAKMLRLELLQVKAELERNLGALVLDGSFIGSQDEGAKPGHWAHREPRRLILSGLVSGEITDLGRLCLQLEER